MSKEIIGCTVNSTTFELYRLLHDFGFNKSENFNNIGKATGTFCYTFQDKFIFGFSNQTNYLREKVFSLFGGEIIDCKDNIEYFLSLASRIINTDNFSYKVFVWNEDSKKGDCIILGFNSISSLNFDNLHLASLEEIKELYESGKYLTSKLR